jgi:hypothetical protein
MEILIGPTPSGPEERRIIFGDTDMEKRIFMQSAAFLRWHRLTSVIQVSWLALVG